MKNFLGVVLGTLLLGTSSTIAQTGTGSAGVNSSKTEGSKTSVAKAAPGKAARVILRGWEVQNASAIKRATLARLLPDYRQRKLVGNVRTDLRPKNGGEYLVVLVQSKWATSQMPNEPLFVGKPDVTLVDENGAEYPAVDSLSPQGGDFVTRGMSGGVRRGEARQRVGRNNQALIYFEVPASSRTFALRFGKSEASLPVNRVVTLPQLDLGSLQQ